MAIRTSSSGQTVLIRATVPSPWRSAWRFASKAASTPVSSPTCPGRRSRRVLRAVPLVGDAESDDHLAHFVTQELGQASVRGDFTCRSGEVATELELLAEDCKADLVVVGRSAHPTLHLGGVPRQLLGRGRFPILVVP